MAARPGRARLSAVLSPAVLWLASLTAVCILLAGCTTGTTPPGPAPSSSAAPTGQAAQGEDPDSTWNGLAAPLGQTATFDSGLAVLVAQPVRWHASAGASGVQPHGVTVSLVVTLTNGQAQSFDAAGLSADAFVGADSATPCTKVRDSAARLWHPLPASIAAGGSGRLTLGYSCPGPSGQPLVVDVTPQAGFASAQFSGSLP